MSAVAFVPSTRWVLCDAEPDAITHLQTSLGISPILARILVNRGLTDPVAAERFLNPRLSDLYDPKLLPDFGLARDAILNARDTKAKIYVHGDYDVDGVTSAAIFSRFLRAIGCDVHTHVPHRAREGFGIHLDAVASARDLGAKLFLTCDCGSSAIEQVDAASEAGMEVLVTDHHEVGEVLPNAVAVINPHRKDSTYPFNELSGAGVAFKVCEGLVRELRPDDLSAFYQRYLDLAALGTIADVMPLIDENRIIAKFGLQALGATRKIGLQALMRAANVEVTPDKPLRAYHVGFVLGPRLNAAGRIDDAALSLKLLLTGDVTEAATLAQSIETLNQQRRAEQERIVEEAIAQVEATEGGIPNVLLVGQTGWNAGVVGIVAGRLVEKFRRPTFVLNIDPVTGVAKGSARTIEGFHLADAINQHRSMFLSGGGHAMAAGCSFDSSRLGELQTALHDYAGGFLTPEDFEVRTRVDAEVAPGELPIEIVEAIQRLEPFGVANPTPTFVARQMLISQMLPTKNPAHMRMTFSTPGFGSVSGIAFGIGERLSTIPPGVTADVLFQPSVDDYRGGRTVKWQVKDLSIA